jgi:hypothetical protein
MSDQNEYRELLKLTRQIGSVPVDQADAAAAIAQVRRGLGDQPQVDRRRILILSGGLAAAIALVIGLAAVMMLSPRKVDAAEALAGAARATQDYRGWVHVVPAATSWWSAPFRPSIRGVHINTADGRFAVDAGVFGARIVEMMLPADHEVQMYTSISGKILVGSVSDDVAMLATKHGAEFPLKLADYLGRLKDRGHAPPTVVETADQGLEKFDLTMTDGPGKAVEDDMPGGKMTVWVDPDSKLFRRVSTTLDGVATVMEYSYGAPDIRDIHDLDVPRTARVIDARQPAEKNGVRAPVFELPDTSKLIKDDATDLRSLEDRLQQHNRADWGDFVLVECNEQKSANYVAHRQGQLTITAREAGQGGKGTKAYYAIYLLVPELELFGGKGYPVGWPTPKLADVTAAMVSARPVRLDATDGNAAWEGETGGPGPLGRLMLLHLKPSTPAIAVAHANFLSFLWPYVGELAPGRGTRVAEVMRDPAHAGLLVLHLDQTSPFRFNNGPANYRNDAYYWLDPSRDDLPVETVIYSNSSGGEKLDDTTHSVYLEFARAGDGRWYPSHWQSRTLRPPTPATPAMPLPNVDEGYREYWRQIFQPGKLQETWYGDPNARMMGSTTRP